MRLPFLFCLCVPFFLFAQTVETPSTSSAVELRQDIGLTRTVLTYHRPSMLGRSVFGELIPFGEIWRTGANEATTISFDRPVNIGDQDIAAGTYSVYTIPGQETWFWVLNGDTSLWGARGYDPGKDVLRFQARPRQLPLPKETMELYWTDISHTDANLTLAWANTQVQLPVHFFTTEQVQKSISAHLNNSSSGSDFYRAARYYLDNDLDLDQALEWMEQRVELEGEQFGILRYKALIEKKLGKEEQAVTSMQRSLEMAREADNEHYVRMNEKSLQSWSEKPFALSGREVVDRSIQYHDTTDSWHSGRFKFTLNESRPGAPYRITQLEIDNGRDAFTMERIQGKEHSFRHSGPEGCTVLINGEEIPFIEAESIETLKCRENGRYRNYYTYVWGLPMKLKDPGTIIEPSVVQRDFMGKSLLEVKVNYEEGVGTDEWYFYFDPESFALRGYRFYHDPILGDGEYISLEGEAEIGNLRLPAKRSWYLHQGNRYLGTDEIVPWDLHSK